MNNNQIFKKIEDLKKDSKLSQALEIFERAEKIYNEAIRTTTIQQKPIKKGTYSTSISTKDYYANISTTTQ